MCELEIQCYNKGCGQKYKEEDNKDNCCQFHPGEPIFHDAYKSWSCCKNRSTDFTTFLNTPGCATGHHNPEKPLEPVKEVTSPDLRDEVIIVEPRKPVVQLTRPSINLPMEKLPVIISQSLKTALLQIKEENMKNQNIDEDSEDEDNDYNEGIKKGETCKNNACSGEYEGEFSNLEDCLFHPGYPIFHEGLKFWSCCKKRSTDFNAFLEQKGCMIGKHLWVKKTTTTVESCRYDWHQTATFVIITVYAKNAQSDCTSISVNPTQLNAHIIFGNDEEFNMNFEFRGIINSKESSVSMAASKIEIKLRKGEPHNWSYLFLNKEKQKISEEVVEDNLNLCDEIETVDLSDI